MRLGLIADLHADIRALEGALQWIDRLGADEILCAGDLVGYGVQPDEVVALVRARSISCVRGNHDRWALELKKVIGLRGWKPADLTHETWEFLSSLPEHRAVEVGGRKIAVFHGSPTSDLDFVTPYKPLPASVETFWESSDADLIVLGHTHIPMIHRHARGTILNPGSVLGVTGVQTSYSFALVDLDTLAVRIHDVRTGREIRRDPVFLGDG
jgi:putative phosphoesterase